MAEPSDTKPSSSSPSTPPTKQPPSLNTLLSWTPLYLHRTAQKSDRTLAILSSILSTPSGTDSLLLLLGYSTLLTSSILTTISATRLKLLSKLLIEKAVSLPPNTVVLIEGSIPPSRLLISARKLKALSSLISDFRIFVRLWGLLGIYQWGKGAWKTSEEGGDVVEKRIVKAQVVVNFFFQMLENGAYLSSKGVMGWNSEKQNKAWLWSSRFWAVHVGLEFSRLGRVFAVKRCQKGSQEGRKVDGPKGDVWTDKAEKAWFEEWKKEFIVNSAWAPLTLHWSVDGGLISDFWVGVAGSVAGIMGVGRRWKAASGSL